MQKLIQQTTQSSEMKSFLLPAQLSQSTINNSHGSNVCMIIALLSGYTVANMKVLHTIAFESLVSEVLLSFLGSIDIGNHLYHYHNCHGFLHFPLDRGIRDFTR